MLNRFSVNKQLAFAISDVINCYSNFRSGCILYEKKHRMDTQIKQSDSQDQPKYSCGSLLSSKIYAVTKGYDYGRTGTKN